NDLQGTSGRKARRTTVIARRRRRRRDPGPQGRKPGLLLSLREFAMTTLGSLLEGARRPAGHVHQEYQRRNSRPRVASKPVALVLGQSRAILCLLRAWPVRAEVVSCWTLASAPRSARGIGRSAPGRSALRRLGELIVEG